MNICIDFRDSGKRIFEREMKEGKRMKDTHQIHLEEKMKLNLFMSIYNTDELINLVKEYQSKFDENGEFKVMLKSLKMIRRWQEDRFNELNEGGN